MMTACPQCDRLVDAEKPRCLYCGAALAPAGQPVASVDAPPGRSSSAGEDRKAGTVNLHDLSPELRRRVEDALRSGTGSGLPAVPVEEKPAREDPIPTMLTAIGRIKESFDADRIDYDEYRTMVVDILMPFIETLSLRDRMNFVFQELQQSELHPYLDEDIFKSLSARVLSAATKIDDEPAAGKSKKRKRFRLFRR